MLYPVPAVLVGSRDEEGKNNLMTAAWAGTICSDPVMLSVSIRKERYSHDVIERTGVFTVSLTTSELACATDFCGVRSGRDTDKFSAMHLTALESEKINAPGVSESPVVLECRVSQILRLGSHDMFIAEVVNVSVDERYLDRNGKLELEKADSHSGKRWENSGFPCGADRLPLRPEKELREPERGTVQQKNGQKSFNNDKYRLSEAVVCHQTAD